MPNKQNLDIVDAFSSKFEKASGVYFTDYLGLSVKDITELRSKFTSDGVEFCVVKNKLAQISFKNAGFEEKKRITEKHRIMEQGVMVTILLCLIFLKKFLFGS